VLSACKVIQLVFVEFYVFRAVHKFDFDLTNGHKWKEGNAVIEILVIDRVYMFSPDRHEC
jgi:hypothetical protein